MDEFFIKKVNELFKIIIEPIDSMYKFTAINNYKNMLEIDELSSLGTEYFKRISKEKSKGAIYTPKEISKFIVKNTICEEDIINNPFIKIVDPACGTGNILKECYTYLRELYIKNLNEINSKWNLKLDNLNINQHILKNNLYGFDIDKTALKILIIDFFNITGVAANNNFVEKDFLIDTIEEKFDIYIGNPPYIGHKTLDRNYSLILKKKYKNIFKDKGDISYCFFQCAINNLVVNGKLGFIVSRYFLESPSGEGLRKVLKDFCTIYKIVDFYGIRPFKNTGVDPVIIFLKNNITDKSTINIIKPLNNIEKNNKNFYKSLFLNKGDDFSQFYIDKAYLNSKGWILRNEKERNIIKKIETKSFTNLDKICNTYQGIITGCDKAFIVNQRTIEDEELEKDLIMPWIKSSSIKKNQVTFENKYLINTDIIENLSHYPNVEHHIMPYKERLLNRRECASGKKEWYRLQWGRVSEIFEGEKIIFPYKSSSNRFALDKGNYFSADVYSLVLKESVPFTYKYLLGILNSKLYEFYFKTYGKKLGMDLYEYYPNNLIKLCIPTMDVIDDYAHINFSDFDNKLYRYFDFTKEEMEIIEYN
ncbi:MAG: modification methylase family protein [Clostridiaceae bacterium]|jgi:adenine-specific DNA-methyltransferase|nr:modification methylase family protein [Clostridiaceae bacterium]